MNNFNQDEMDEALTIKQVAELLKLNPRTLYDWVNPTHKNFHPDFPKPIAGFDIKLFSRKEVLAYKQKYAKHFSEE